MQLSPMTELDAINIMLSVIGEAPVNTISVTGLGDVAVAKQILNEVSREVQEKSWVFNTEDNVPITPTVEGYVNVPTNVLRIDAANSEPLDVVQRGERMYDRRNRTFSFDNTYKFNITYMLDFNEIPQAARYYITIRAARKFAKRVLGSNEIDRLTQEDEFQALVALQDMDTDVADYNILTGSADTARILMR